MEKDNTCKKYFVLPKPGEQILNTNMYICGYPATDITIREDRFGLVSCCMKMENGALKSSNPVLKY